MKFANLELLVIGKDSHFSRIVFVVLYCKSIIFEILFDKGQSTKQLKKNDQRFSFFIEQTLSNWLL